MRRSIIRQKVEVVYQRVEEEKGKDSSELEVDALRSDLNKLERYLEELRKFDDLVQETLEGQELEEEVSESENMRDRLQTAIFELSCWIGKLTSDTGSVSGNRIMPKLPKLAMRKFGGDPIAWQPFWDQFESSIHSNSQLTDVDKFNYLKGLLEGDASRAIDGIALTSVNYRVAIKILQERFGDPQVVIAAHFDEILNLEMPETNPKALRRFVDAVEKHIRSLVALGQDEAQYANVLVPMLLRKIPAEVKLEITRTKGNVPWDLQKLRKLLSDEVAARETVKNRKRDKDRVVIELDGDEWDGGEKAERASASALLIGSRKRRYEEAAKKRSDVQNTRGFKPDLNGCWLCGDHSHQKRTCPNIKCFRCGSLGHLKRDCKKEDGAGGGARMDQSTMTEDH